MIQNVDHVVFDSSTCRDDPMKTRPQVFVAFCTKRLTRLLSGRCPSHKPFTDVWPVPNAAPVTALLSSTQLGLARHCVARVGLGHLVKMHTFGHLNRLYILYIYINHKSISQSTQVYSKPIPGTVSVLANLAHVRLLPIRDSSLSLSDFHAAKPQFELAEES